MEGLEKAFLFKIGIYTYHHGNIQNCTYIWKIDSNVLDSEMINKHYSIREDLKKQLQVFHTRAMQKEFLDLTELYFGKIEKARVKHLIKHLLHDSSTPDSLSEKDIDNRITLMVELGDPEMITDLRHLNQGRPEKFDIFWDYAKKYLEGTAENLILAVDDRRHDLLQHLAHAISVRDFRDQVKKICPAETEIPSIQWIRLQFHPQNPTYKSSIRHTGKLNAKFMVQARQLRINHMDTHYASAIFRYLKEMAVLFNNNSWLVFMDDKHHCKIGEPGYPVAAVERGKQVLVSCHTKFQVADHDFTKCGIIPSVIMLCDIPDNIDQSFYRGKVSIGLKDPIFEPSDPF